MVTDPRANDPAETDRRQELLTAWQDAEDLDALDALLRTEIDALKRAVRHRGGDLLGGTLAATDLAHEAVLRLMRVEDAPHFENPRALRGYLWKCAWRLLLERYEQRRRRPARVGLGLTGGLDGWVETTGGLDGAEEEERSVALQVAMNLLKPEDREILTLVYFEDLDVAAAAAKLGIAKDAANMRLVRARRRLGDKLSGWASVISD